MFCKIDLLIDLLAELHDLVNEIDWNPTFGVDMDKGPW